MPLVGPSSLLLALMASGMNGQSFAFHGYLPVAAGERAAALRRLEDESRAQRRAQLFIETPYRNEAMLKTIGEALRPGTRVVRRRRPDAADRVHRAPHCGRMAEADAARYAKRPAIFILEA